MKKQFILGFVVGALVFGSTGVYAGTKFTAEKTNITIDYYGKELKPEIFDINGENYVHVKGLFEALGNSVTWKPGEKKFVIGDGKVDGQAALENERLFEANHRVYVSAVALYVAENNGRYPNNNQDVSKFLPIGGCDGKPDGASYTVKNGMIISVYPKHRDPDKRILIFNQVW